MNCPGCKAGIGLGPFPVVGVLKILDLDKDSVETGEDPMLRVSSEFMPLVAVTCDGCGMVFFLSIQQAKQGNISLDYHHIG